ncbi:MULTISPECIES: F18 fimbrial protein FedE [unclassified Escherichia]|uniref:F18 fimbrial protein FedE n=1 Tax=unclassified Escherichia TaxID=2608889 RepID=UPI001102B5A2|nr:MULTISPECIES: F18 fimbrial protein FedE [unclassified Escherichia]TGC04058.1 F18 fimbrial protein FedE [Escherichia sp. E2586]
MKFTKAVLAVLMITVMTGNGQAASTTTATLMINVTFTQPSCDITVPSSYNLGLLIQGEKRKEHPPLNITWTCGGDTPQKTALTATIISGDAEGDEKIYLMTDSSQRTGATLSLKEKATGSMVKLTGKNGGNPFCNDVKESTDMRTCTLIPVTDVSQSGALGMASARLKFEVAYQ